jgi:hypothetical protein
MRLFVFQEFRPFHGGAEAAAVQTLRDCQAPANRAKRLDCGAFTAAFASPATWISRSLQSNSQARCLCHYHGE